MAEVEVGESSAALGLLTGHRGDVGVGDGGGRGRGGPGELRVCALGGV